MNARDFRRGDLVRYVPQHAHGDSHHPDCQIGVVCREALSFDPAFFVLFSGSTPQRCSGLHLIFLARWEGFNG